MAAPRPTLASSAPVSSDPLLPSTISSLVTSLPSSTPFPFNAITSLAPNGSSSSNTYPIVTTTGIQIVPLAPADASTSTGSTPSFPVAAIAVIAIVCGLFLIFASYKTYAWWYRRRRMQEVVHTYPAARPSIAVLGGGGSLPSRLSMSASTTMSQTAEGGFGSIWAQNAGKRSSSMMFAPEAGWSGKEEKEALFEGSEMGMSGSWSPVGGGSISREGSPFGGSGSMSSIGGGGGMPSSQPSRASMMLGGGRHSYGSQQQLRTVGSNPRLNGAPHHSRIDIIPPLPLAPPPGSVVAMDKSTLEFSNLSGIGAGRLSEEWGLLRSGSHEELGFPPPNQRGRDTRGVPSGSGSAGSTGSRGSSSPRERSFPSPSQSPSTPAFLALHPLPPFPHSTSAASSPTYGHFPPQSGRPSSHSREAKARQRTERVRRANGGDDGTGTEMESFESGSGTGSTSGSGHGR